ncbi:MAG: sulfite exporter TauE/SafE family protein [Bacteroidetes bacterium]|nr:sulfite exporter TauE/SafE family protein [Bacteroidota bacterium]
MSQFPIFVALLMGLTGSLHCAGMCGPIIWIMPFQSMSGIKKWLSVGLYHIGRISVYAAMGLLLHSFKSFFHPQWQQYISIFAGSILLILGVISFLPQQKKNFQLPWSEFVKRKLGLVVGRPQLSMLFLSGLLNGLLPCGLVYMALSMSVTAGSAGQAIALMYAFGIGTVPILLAITILKSKASFLRLPELRKFVPVIMFFFGSLFILRGMNLGIPYLSPQIAVDNHQIKATCCHKD